jgi:hypothetical protein
MVDINIRLRHNAENPATEQQQQYWIASNAYALDPQTMNLKIYTVSGDQRVCNLQARLYARCRNVHFISSLHAAPI